MAKERARLLESRVSARGWLYARNSLAGVGLVPESYVEVWRSFLFHPQDMRLHISLTHPLSVVSSRLGLGLLAPKIRWQVTMSTACRRTSTRTTTVARWAKDRWARPRTEGALFPPEVAARCACSLNLWQRTRRK